MQQPKVAWNAQESGAQFQMQEVQADLVHEGGAWNSHNSGAHVQVPKVWYTVWAQDAPGETF